MTMVPSARTPSPVRGAFSVTKPLVGSRSGEWLTHDTLLRTIQPTPVYSVVEACVRAVIPLQLWCVAVGGCVRLHLGRAARIGTCEIASQPL